MNRTIIWPLLVAAAFTFLINAQLRAQSKAASLYKAKCELCHGADGSGNGIFGKSMKMRDLRSADVQKQTDDQLIEIVAKGKNKMPGYATSLKDSQIKDLVGYIRNLAKKK
jgi:mono/diheme cytochrome c family protein